MDVSRPRILCMEDDEGVATLIQRRLDRLGYAVDIAANGKEGLAMIEGADYDAVTIDYKMPDLDGLGVLRAMAEMEKPPPGIMVSGAGDLNVAMEAVRLGAADYVIKETGKAFFDLLSNTIDNILERARLLKEKEDVEEALKKAHDELEKRVEERTKELQESHVQLSKLSQTVEQSPSLVFMTDTEGCIEYVNPKFLELTGYSPDEVIGQNPRILKSEETPPEVYEDLWRTIMEGKVWRGEIQDRCKDGTIFWATVTISPIRGEDGTITHYVAVHEDITARKEAEAAMKLSAQQAEIANRAKTELMANMSHELRTPLNAIIGFSSSIKEQMFGPIGHEKYLEYVCDIHSSGEHLLELINDILDVSAIEAGELKLNEENLDLCEVINAAIRLIMPRAVEGNVTLITECRQTLPKIYADERRVKQIAINLLSNAVKFTEEGGEVSVKVFLNDSGALTAVFADTGIGMDEKEMAVAMTKFGQVDGGLARKHQGTGLGIPLTQRLVEVHGGTFVMESEKGKGTTVTVTFPKERIIHRPDHD